MVPILSEFNYVDIPALRAKFTELNEAVVRPESPLPVDVRDLSGPGPEGAPEAPVRIYTSQGGPDADGAQSCVPRGHSSMPAQRPTQPDPAPCSKQTGHAGG